MSAGVQPRARRLSVRFYDQAFSSVRLAADWAVAMAETLPGWLGGHPELPTRPNGGALGSWLPPTAWLAAVNAAVRRAGRAA